MRVSSCCRYVVPWTIYTLVLIIVYYCAKYNDTMPHASTISSTCTATKHYRTHSRDSHKVPHAPTHPWHRSLVPQLSRWRRYARRTDGVRCCMLMRGVRRRVCFPASHGGPVARTSLVFGDLCEPNALTTPGNVVFLVDTNRYSTVGEAQYPNGERLLHRGYAQVQGRTARRPSQEGA